MQAALELPVQKPAAGEEAAHGDEELGRIAVDLCHHQLAPGCAREKAAADSRPPSAPLTTEEKLADRYGKRR